MQMPIDGRAIENLRGVCYMRAWKRRRDGILKFSYDLEKKVVTHK